ncbi:alkene reductase [Mucilaginibacter sp.]|uniref:alkene reductase n=1 Tax=Mucilaginibacter sp. TaxID=1882438 RepID=UPI0025DA128D|nr:alkene reductase [Mucilaginibacter sp.]
MQTNNNTETAVNSTDLFTPVQLGPYKLTHRVVMAPLTRMRTESDFVPNDLLVEHYSQRATQGGYIVAEGTVISETGHGYYGAPGIYTDEQVEGWKRVTAAVHNKGGIIFDQLFHVGRQSHRSLQPNGDQPIGASAIEFEDFVYTPTGWLPTDLNRAMTTEEVKAMVEDYRKAAIRAKEAGFDGVELHGANGYLVDQFLQDGSNQRTDIYGGSIENRVRFMLEIVEALVEVWGANRVAVRLGPSGTFASMFDSDPIALFGYAAEQLNKFGLAYLHLIEPRVKGSVEEVEDLEPVAAMHLRKIFKGTIIAAGGFDGEKANDILQKGNADLVAFGRHFIANPDLVFRLKNNLPLNVYDRDTFYGGDARGYNDYPFYKEEEALSA